jgi:N utilization substance protein B
MQILYAYETQPLTGIKEHWESVVSMMDMAKFSLTFAEELVNETVANLHEINKLLSKFLENWALTRVEKVNLAVLRVAVCELLTQKNIPSAVIINEAIEISKLYAEPSSSALINGVLDGISKRVRVIKETAQDAVAD